MGKSLDERYNVPGIEAELVGNRKLNSIAKVDCDEIHPKMYRFFVENKRLTTSEEILDYTRKLLTPFMGEDFELLGSGGEGFVFRDGNKVSKFVLNWDFPKRDTSLTYERLKRMSDRIFFSRHLYKFSVSMIDIRIMLISYLYELTEPLSLNYLQKYWYNDLKKQYQEFLIEMLGIGFKPKNPKIKNFRLLNYELKFIDYGCDCCPSSDRLSEEILDEEIRFFLEMNQVENLGTTDNLIL